MTTDDQVEECRTTAALYSLGALPPDETLRFEQRLKSGCPFCTAEFAEYSLVAESLALTVPAHEPDPSMRQRLLNRVTATSQTPAPNSDITVVRGGDSPWVKLPIPGVEIRPLLGKDTLLVRMQPGSVYPAHEHQQSEQCYVLEGSIVGSDGTTVSAGDFVCMRAGSKHDPIHTETGCVFLVAYTA